MKQLLTESLLLATLGGGLGLVFAWLGDRLLTFALARYDLSLPNARIVEIDWRVLLFTLAITLLTSVIFGSFPALRSARPDLTARPARRIFSPESLRGAPCRRPTTSIPARCRPASLSGLLVSKRTRR